jgi:hypothetical protein
MCNLGRMISVIAARAGIACRLVAVLLCVGNLLLPIYFFNMHFVGEIIHFPGTGVFADGIDCEVLEIFENGAIKKLKACNRDERLARMGWLMEGEDYVMLPWQWSQN